MEIQMFSDGAARGNPGPASFGVILKNDQGKTIFRYGKYLGKQTNNVAEYSGIYAGILKAKELKVTELNIFVDSELATKQIKGIYKVRNEELKKIYSLVMEELKTIPKWSITHIKREKNKEADALANQVLDQQ